MQLSPVQHYSLCSRLGRYDSLGAVPSRQRYEDLWRALPEAIEPSDFDLRKRFLLERLRERMGERVGFAPQVLDVGCGEARFADELARAGAQVVGIDVAEEPLRRARARHPELDLRRVEVDGPWELEDASFDIVWAGEVIEHVADTAAWLSEVRRVLRSGGSLIVSTPAHEPLTMLRLALSRSAFARHFEPLGDHLRFYSNATLSALFSEFRFEQIEVRSAGGRHGARAVLLAHALRARF
jgi:2-polyprenyl-3-methyl-5-hydroxy-6-metoxy-1,4-benzoquinol methylase